MEGQVDKSKLMLKCPKERVIEFLHGVIDGICEEGNSQYSKFSEVWGLEEWWDVNDYFKEFCQQCMNNTWSKDEMSTNLEGLSEEYKCLVTETVLLRRDDIRRCLVSSTASITHAQLKDFDWQMKLVMSSDRLASIQEPILSVDFDVQSDSRREVVSVELKREDLRKMITSLEGAQKAVLQLKTS